MARERERGRGSDFESLNRDRRPREGKEEEYNLGFSGESQGTIEFDNDTGETKEESPGANIKGRFLHKPVERL